MAAALAVGAALTAVVAPLAAAKESYGFIASTLGWTQLLLSAIVLWPQVR